MKPLTAVNQVTERVDNITPDGGRKVALKEIKAFRNAVSPEVFVRLPTAIKAEKTSIIPPCSGPPNNLECIHEVPSNHDWKVEEAQPDQKQCRGFCERCNCVCWFGAWDPVPRLYVCIVGDHKVPSEMRKKIDGAWLHTCAACWDKREKEGSVSSKT